MARKKYWPNGLGSFPSNNERRAHVASRPYRATTCPKRIKVSPHSAG